MAEYFITFAVLFFIYVCVRYPLLQYWHLPPLPKEPPDFSTAGFDASQVLKRVNVVRKEITAPKPARQSNSFKRALLVEKSRVQVTKLSFFQSPPAAPPEPDEADEDLHLFLV